MSAPLSGTLFDYEARIVSLLGFIDSSQIDLIVDQLLRLDTESTEEITVYVSCRGGHMVDALKLVDTVTILNSKITSVAFGLLEGAGILLLACANQRLLFPSTLVSTAGLWELPQMHHQARSHVGINATRSPSDHLRQLVEQRVREAFDPRLLIRDPNSPPRILTAQECIEFGLVDAVIDGPQRLLKRNIPPKHTHEKIRLSR